MIRTFPSAREWRDVDANVFRNEIEPLGEPAVLRGLVSDWPAVKAAKQSNAAIGAYLQERDGGRPVDTLAAPPAAEGRFFYNDDMTAMNFRQQPAPLREVVGKLLELTQEEAKSPALYVQSTSIADFLPRFGEDNALALLPGVSPRIWIGNAIVVQTHFDLFSNIACAVAGRRRFTLFPPDQIANLYPGPFDFTPAGPPVSMVSLENPDLERYPRFAEALETARVAELGPGDAVYIPYAWWHHVRSLEKFNVLVNYWWSEAPQQFGSAFDSLLHGVMAIRSMPDSQRHMWRAMFDYFVFQTSGEPLSHLPADRRGLLGEVTPEKAAQIRAILMRQLGSRR